MPNRVDEDVAAVIAALAFGAGVSFWWPWIWILVGPYVVLKPVASILSEVVRVRRARADVRAIKESATKFRKL